jgi:hypothetical protein
MQKRKLGNSGLEVSALGFADAAPRYFLHIEGTQNPDTKANFTKR